MTTRNWYQAICDDLGINLIALRKSHETSITENSLQTYRDKGATPSKDPGKKGILALIQTQHRNFTMEALEKYFQGEYAEDPKARTQQQCVSNINKALKAINDTDLHFDELLPGLPSEHDELATWLCLIAHIDKST